MLSPNGALWLAAAGAAATLCAAMGLVAWRRSSRLESPERLLAAMLPTLGLLAVLLLVEPVLVSTANAWNDIRLTPAAALVQGYGIYYLPGEGPMLGHIYGPVAPLVYLPALLWSTPSAAIRAGTLLTLCWLTLPVFMMIRDLRGRRAVLAGGCLVLFVLLLHARVVRMVAFGIHSDTPAVALAAIACWCLIKQERRTQTIWLAASALAAVLSAGSKQVAFPVLLALPTYVWLADGRGAAFRYGRLIVGFGVAALAVVAVTIDVPAMLYQALVIPSEHDWRYGNASVVFVHTIRDLVPRVLPFATVVAGYGLYRLGRVGWSDLNRWAHENPWLVPVFVGVFCIPTSMLGRMKQGGSMNSLIYTVYFLLVGALLALLHAGNLKTASHGVTARRAMTVFVIATLGVTTVLTVPQLRRLPETVQDLPHDVVSAAFRFVKEHPGEVYLPYHPLVTLMAEDQAYHLLLETQSRQYFEYLVGGSDLAASEADDRSFFAFIPPHMKYVLYRTDGGTPLTSMRRPYQFQDHLWRYRPDLATTIPIAPGWAALVEDAAQPSPR